MLMRTCEKIKHLIVVLLLFTPFGGQAATTKITGDVVTQWQLLKFNALGEVVPTTASTEIAVGVAMNVTPAALGQAIPVEITDDVTVLAESGITAGQYLLPSDSIVGGVAGSTNFVQGVLAIAEGDESGGLVKAHFHFGFPIDIGSSGGIDHSSLLSITIDDHHNQSHALNSGSDHTGILDVVQLPANVAFFDTTQDWTADQTFTTGILMFNTDVGAQFGTLDEFSILFSSANNGLNITPVTGDGSVFFTSFLTGDVDITFDGDFLLEDGNLLLDDSGGNTLDIVLGAGGQAMVSSSNMSLRVGTSGMLALFDDVAPSSDPIFAVGGKGTSATVFMALNIGTEATNNNATFSNVTSLLALTDGDYVFKNNVGTITLGGKSISFDTFGESITNTTNDQFDFNFTASVVEMTADTLMFNNGEGIQNTVDKVLAVVNGGGQRVEFDFNVAGTNEINSDVEFLKLKGNGAAFVTIKTNVFDFNAGNLLITGGVGTDDIIGWTTLEGDAGDKILNDTIGEITFSETGAAGFTVDLDALNVSLTATTARFRIANTIEFEGGNFLVSTDTEDILLSSASGATGLLFEMDDTGNTVKLGTNGTSDPLRLQDDAEAPLYVFGSSSTDENRGFIIFGENAAQSGVTFLTMRSGDGGVDNDIDYIAKTGDLGYHVFTTDAGRGVKTGGTTQYFIMPTVTTDPDGSVTAPQGSFVYDSTSGRLEINTDGFTDWDGIALTE